MEPSSTPNGDDLHAVPQHDHLHEGADRTHDEVEDADPRHGRVADVDQVADRVQHVVQRWKTNVGTRYWSRATSRP